MHSTVEVVAGIDLVGAVEGVAIVGLEISWQPLPECHSKFS